MCQSVENLYVHGGGLSSSVVTQESSDLTLIKAEAEAVHSRSGASGEHFDQVFDADTFNQISWLCLKELLTCKQQG